MQLVDTNVLGELTRPVPNAGVVRWLAEAESLGLALAVSATTVDEVMFGLTRRPRGKAYTVFNAFALRYRVLEVDEIIARRAGELRGMQSLRGHVRTQADMLVAATAQVHGLPLVTRNVRDFDGCSLAVLNPFDA